MEGTVLGYQADEGVIRTADGTRFIFGPADWKSPYPPAAGQRVDFVAEDGRAREIYLLNPATGALFSTIDGIRNSERTVPMIVYCCYLGALLYGITMIIGVIVAYIYRQNSSGTWYGSHFDYQISIFWKSLIGFVLGFATMFFGVGIVILIFTYLWVIVKIIKGWQRLAEGKPAPVPAGPASA